MSTRRVQAVQPKNHEAFRVLSVRCQRHPACRGVLPQAGPEPRMPQASSAMQSFPHSTPGVPGGMAPPGADIPGW